MRVTNSMMVSQFLSDANSSLNRVAKNQQKVNTSKKISGIADDPLATVASLKARNRLSALSNYQNTLSTATSYLTEAESATKDINEVLKSTYELMVSANSGAKDSSELQTISNEIANLRDELLSIANSSVGTSYIFGGDNTDKAPFSVDGAGALIYNGINLSAIAAGEEYDAASTGVLTSAAEIDSLISSLDGISDYNAKNSTCLKIYDGLKKMISGVNSAYENAKQYSGMVSGYPEDKLQGLSDLADSLNSIKDELFGEMSQELLEDGTGLTPEEIKNSFSVDECKNILVVFSNLSDSANPANVENRLTEADIVIPNDTLDQLQKESDITTELKVGSATFMGISANGIELMGVGKSNLYCLLDKCTKVLSGELDGSPLSGLIGDLQNAQNNNSTLRTRFGASLARIDMMTERYTTSELNYTSMKSDAEDADMAEAIVELTTAKTVYDAALAAGSQIIQISLLDFLK